MSIVLRAGKAWTDSIGELPIILVGLSVDHDIADDLRDGRAGRRADGHLG